MSRKRHPAAAPGRREFLQRCVAGAAASLGVAGCTAPGGSGRSRSRPAGAAEARRRATAAYDALVEHFYDRRGNGLLLGAVPVSPGDDFPYAFAWPYSQALAATVDVYGLHRQSGGGGDGEGYERDLTRRREGLRRYWDAGGDPPGYYSYVGGDLGFGGDKFYDDNEWLGLELVQVYRLTGDERALERAREVFEFVVSGWSGDDFDCYPGGVYWKATADNRDRNTVSNAPGAELGLHLAQLTGDPERRTHYLEWAKRMYRWVRETLLAPDGLYWDHVGGNCGITDWTFTYNQGTMVGAGVLLHEVTGDQRYLEHATDTAAAALDRYGVGALRGQPLPFNAIFFKTLLLLTAARDRTTPAYADRLRRYADAVWAPRVDPETALIENSEGVTTLLEQASLVQLYAALAWDPARYGVLA